MLISFLILASWLSPQPATASSPVLNSPRLSSLNSVHCERVAWLDLHTVEIGRTYCLAEPQLKRIVGVMEKVQPGTPFWVEEVDCRKVSGTQGCKTSKGIPVVLYNSLNQQ